MRRTKSKGNWQDHKASKAKKEVIPSEQPKEIEDEGTVVGVSDFFKGLLRGKKK